MHIFRWVSANEIPHAFDLRERGWRLAPAVRGAEDECVFLAQGRGLDSLGWVRLLIIHPPATRRRILLLGIDDGESRARLLRLGFGDVVGNHADISEIEARAARLAEQARMLPRYRDLGQLRLDLLSRDGFAGGRALGLHPREFALIWRLADSPGAAVPKQALLHDVWRLNHVPETNSLAVHVSRLRSKLESAGLQDMVRTNPAGGYFLAMDASGERQAIPLAPSLCPLDSHVRLGEHGGAAAAGGGDRRPARR